MLGNHTAKKGGILDFSAKVPKTLSKTFTSAQKHDKTVTLYFFIYLCAYFVQNDEKPYLLPYFIINHVLM